MRVCKWHPLHTGCLVILTSEYNYYGHHLELPMIFRGSDYWFNRLMIKVSRWLDNRSGYSSNSASHNSWRDHIHEPTVSFPMHISTVCWCYTEKLRCVAICRQLCNLWSVLTQLCPLQCTSFPLRYKTWHWLGTANTLSLYSATPITLYYCTGPHSPFCVTHPKSLHSTTSPFLATP